MLLNIINYSLRHKFVVLLFVAGIIGFGIYALQNIPIGAVQDITTSDLAVRITNFNQRIKFEKSKLESEMRKLKDGSKLCLLG